MKGINALVSMCRRFHVRPTVCLMKLHKCIPKNMDIIIYITFLYFGTLCIIMLIMSHKWVTHVTRPGYNNGFIEKQNFKHYVKMYWCGSDRAYAGIPRIIIGPAYQKRFHRYNFLSVFNTERLLILYLGLNSNVLYIPRLLAWYGISLPSELVWPTIYL